MSRVEIDRESETDRVSVIHQPDETVRTLVDDVRDEHFLPVQTTVMVVDEDELLDHETVANRSRAL